IFVGYGFSIRDDTLQWDDYQSVDVQGKWVLVLRSDPDLDNPKSVFAESSSDWYKVMNAAYHGAAGVLFVNTVDYDKEDEIKKLRPENGVSPAKVPVIQIKRELADKILSSTNNTIEKLEKKFDAERAPFSFNTNCLVNAHTELELFKEKTTNVTGFLKGTSDTDDCLIFGAHYDHLGLGGGSSKTPDTVAVHYGADDNASGIAMLIELAQKASREKPERNLLFIAFGAEEMGLLGSKYYVNNPLKDLAEAKIMFNFDMVGRLNENNAVTVNGTGTAKETDSLLTLSLDSNSFKFIRSTRRSGISCRH
ncbi:MAG: M20/M25/M40 family metallo-hydrolase, partial [Bacteroidales bacterium]|nr:M20/M25/M40 family metallo-hydrolase [Bacteroidales bacterium]